MKNKEKKKKQLTLSFWWKDLHKTGGAPYSFISKATDVDIVMLEEGITTLQTYQEKSKLWLNQECAIIYTNPDVELTNV